MAHLVLNVLGEMQVFIAGTPIASFESDKVRALLAYLAVESGRAHRRESLVGLLWPDWPEQSARHNLRQALFNLRQALGDHSARPPYLAITREAIQFNRESDYSLDLDQFLDNFANWEQNQGRARGEHSALIRQLEDLVCLYRGDFLQQFSLADSAEFEEWILVQREALHQRVLNALAYLATHFEEQASYQAARRYAARQLELDPWREEAHAQLMRVLALDGQRSAALAQYETCRRVLGAELGVEPSVQTQAIYEQIRLDEIKPSSAVPSGPVAPIHNLPVSLTPFLGREQELAELAEWIGAPECRCITLTGPGGIGKTRLALQAASQHRHAFAQGSAFVPLASIASVETAIPAIAGAVHYEFYGPSDPKAQLIGYLRDKEMLLVIDDVEHLLAKGAGTGTIADLLVEILQQAPLVKLLVTSREALRLQGEWLFEVHGLSYPELDESGGLEDYGSVALFVQHARRARPGFALAAVDRLGVVQLCRLVEGMPLAIELAAAWVRLLSPAEIAGEVASTLDFLNAQMRDLPARHRSMRAVFDRSWDTLSRLEKQALSRLSVFRGGFRRQAAEQVAGANLPVLASLATRSLLRRTASGSYDLHPLVRQFAAGKLAEDQPQNLTTQAQHGRYYLELLVEKDPELHGRRQKEALAELASEIDNLRAAWEWAIGAEQWPLLYQASGPYWYLFELRNWYKEAEATFQTTIEALRESMARSGSSFDHQVILHSMLAHCGYFQFRLGRGEAAYGVMAPSAAFLRTNGEPAAAIYSTWYLGLICWQLGRLAEARQSLQECLALSREHRHPWYEALAGEFLASLARDEGAYPLSQQYLREALAIFRQQGDPMMISHGLTDLGRVLMSMGESSEAESLVRESLEITRELDCRFGMGAALDVLGQIACLQASYAEARAHFAESASLFLEIGDPYRLAQVLNHQGLLCLSLEDATGAENAFNRALKVSYDHGLTPCTLDALAGLAALNPHRQNNREILILVIYIYQHPATGKETFDLAAKLRGALESRLDQQELETALQAAASRRLDEFVGRFYHASG